MSPFSMLITGCNRGIGLELVKQFLKRDPAPSHLFATARNTTAAGELTKLAASNENLHLIQLDVTNYKDYPEVVNKVSHIVGDKGLNLLINNAGVFPEENRDLESVTPEDMRSVFEVNCIAPLFLTKAMLPLIKQAAQTNAEKPIGIHKAAIIQMSTLSASIAWNSIEGIGSGGAGGSYAKKCSKTALNMAMKSLSVDLAGTNILELSMHPGWVITAQGGPNANIENGAITTETCCVKMLETLEGLTEKDHGSFLGYDNTPMQW